MTPDRHAARLGRPFSTKEVVDFVVVGSGAAGGVVARELARAGYSVVVLEQGPHLDKPDFTHDEFANFALSKLTANPKTKPQTYRLTEADTAKEQTCLVYATLVGGTSVHYAANFWRFRDVDFSEGSRTSGVPGASLADWPITYTDLEPYYTRAEWEVGISGQAGVNPKEPFRSKPYPMPPIPLTGPGALLEVAGKKLGWLVQPAPMAILSQPYRGRHQCMACGFCWGFGCEWGAKSSTLFSMIPDAVASGRCEVRPLSYVREVEMDDSGRATGVVYFDANKQEVRQRAKVVVLCANGAETPRLLLMSKSNRFPDGLANSSGLVGKNLMFNGGAISGGRFEHPVNGYRGAPVSRITLEWYEFDPALNLSGGAGMDFRHPGGPMLWSMLAMPPSAPKWGAGLKHVLRDYYTNSCMAFGHTTSLPQPTNTIDLDPTVVDAWGLPAIRVTYKNHENDMRLMTYMGERCIEALNAAGALETWSLPVQESPGRGFHLLGTCRMGNDPAHSVVDRWHRTHDVPNLFLVDGSSFVTSGRGQPTLTITALAFRAAEGMARAAKRGDLGNS